MNPELLGRVARFARREALFRRAQNIMVAVSGGADSVACLLVLQELRAEFGFELQVVHFDHQLRPESRKDLEFVRDLAAKLDVPFLSGEGDVASVAREQKASIEDTARKMRYQFLAFVAAEKRADRIATGHTADDQAETVLMRVLRGTGVRGIRGMLPAADVPGAPAQRLIRPLLPLTRADTEQICRDAGITPLEDSTNTDISILRNRLRQETLPALRAINPSVETALLGLAASAREMFADVERESHAVQPRERGPVGALFDLRPLAQLLNEALTLVIEREASFYQLPVDVNRTRLNNLRTVLEKGTGEVRFGECVVAASVGTVRIGPRIEAEPFEGKVLNVPGITLAGHWRVQVTTSELPPAPGTANAKIETAGQKGALRIRPVAPGDRMRYRGIDRKLSDIFALERVPTWDRAAAVVIADSARVLAVLTTGVTLEADPTENDFLFVRLAPHEPEQRAAPRLELLS